MANTARRLYKLFDKGERKSLILLVFMMLAAALLEIVGIGLIVPFITLATNPDAIHSSAPLAFVYRLFRFPGETVFIISGVIVLLGVFMFKNAYILWYQNRQYKVILNQQVKLSQRLFNAYLIKPYVFHLQRNTAVLLRNVNVEVPKVFHGIVLSALQLAAELVVVVCIFALLLAIEPVATLVVSALLAVSVIVFFGIFNKKIGARGREQQTINKEMIKWVNQGLGASKEIKVSGKESFFVRAFTGQSKLSADNTRAMKVLDHIPRLFIETMLVSTVLAMLVVIILQDAGVTALMSTMALFSLAAFRLMPSINRIIAMITSIKYSLPAFDVVYEDLLTLSETDVAADSVRQPASGKGDAGISDCIRLDNVSFRYPGHNEFAVKHISLSIPAGKSAALIGESGSGKSTLVDIMLGLLKPEEGAVMVDDLQLEQMGESWGRQIGYIPQVIYLTDDCIRANVAFGLDAAEIDDDTVWNALEQAQLKEFVAALPDKLNTQVGERGVRLSGGQRQRIGIARALYHNPAVLFMDEATSALDNETEQEVMNAVDSLRGKKTIIIIAHRLSTIKNCDIVFALSQGRLAGIETRGEVPMASAIGGD